MLLLPTGPVDVSVAVNYRAVCAATYNLYKTTLLIFCGNYMVCHKTCYKTLHQQHMFSFFQITIPSHKQLPPILSQTFLHFILASLSLHPLPHPHLKVLCVVFICLFVDCVATFKEQKHLNKTPWVWNRLRSYHDGFSTP